MNWCVLKINLFIAFLVVLFETLILLEKHIAMLQENKGQSEMNKQFKWRFYSNLIRFYVLIYYFVQLCIKSNQRQFTLIYLVYVSCSPLSFTFFTNKQEKRSNTKLSLIAREHPKVDWFKHTNKHKGNYTKPTNARDDWKYKFILKYM